jgi:RNA polymerase sigma-70 factor, ECF subfamily
MLGVPPLWVSRVTLGDGQAADAELIRDARQGSEDAFEALFVRYRDPVWRFFRRRVADHSRAEELSQDLFVALLQGAARYESRASFRSYLFGIAYNLLAAERRVRGGTPVEPLGDVPARTADHDASMWVRRALAALEPEDREILMLREYEELSYQELADLLGLPLNTVRSRLFRARAALRAALTAKTGTGEQS